ncbi:MAG TPA: flagellar hook-basal body complex protein FliE [Solirubrobacteraceae bacterium]|nr:flagellar hook-basal body complex protein FliE [Solirubrobacteraceae bacterium]
MSALGPGASIGGVGSIGGIGGSGSVAQPAKTGATSFGSALAQAVGGLEQTQNTAATAAQGLATGTISDPATAVTAVENASLAMDVASQIQNKLIAAETTLFQLQV